MRPVARRSWAVYSFVLLIVIINIPLLSDVLVSRPIRFVMNMLQSLFQTQIVHGLA